MSRAFAYVHKAVSLIPSTTDKKEGKEFIKTSTDTYILVICPLTGKHCHASLWFFYFSKDITRNNV